MFRITHHSVRTSSRGSLSPSSSRLLVLLRARAQHRLQKQQPAGLITTSRCYSVINQSTPPTPPQFTALENSQQRDEARAWLTHFRAFKIPRDLAECSFARSSGPGGQNVNKVNTKAIVRIPLESAWIPLWARDSLRDTRFYVNSSQSLQVMSDAHRSQAQNLDECLEQLHDLITTSASTSITKEPSAEQARRVRQLEKAEKERNKVEKMRRSAVKGSRGRAGDD